MDGHDRLHYLSRQRGRQKGMTSFQAIYGTASVRYRLFPPGPVTTIEL